MDPKTLIRKYRSLRARYDAGRIEPEAFVAACAELRGQDENGQWWGVDTLGRLLRHDAGRGAWVPVVEEVGEDEEPADDRPTGPARPAIKPPVKAARPARRAPAQRPAGGDAVAWQALIVGLPVVFVISLIVSYAGWDFFKLLPLWINAVTPGAGFPGRGCVGIPVGSIQMHLCAAAVGLRVMFGSLVVIGALFVLRKPIAAAIENSAKHLPPLYRPILSAIVAASFFAIVWAGTHPETGDRVGLMNNRSFPALVGAISFLAMRFGPVLMAHLPGLFAARDRMSMFKRWMTVLLVPLTVAFLLTNPIMQVRVSEEALTQQLVVIVGLVTGFLVLAPRPEVRRREGRP